MLEAVVRGSDGTHYETAVYFQSQAGAELTFGFGECTCPVGVNCKHVVAVAVAATGADMGADAEFAARARAAGPASERRCRSAGHRALPVHPTGTLGAAHRGVGGSEVVGPAGAIGPHRVGGQRDDVEQARISLQLR
jgi:hypothetical protein